MTNRRLLLAASLILIACETPADPQSPDFASFRLEGYYEGSFRAEQVFFGTTQPASGYYVNVRGRFLEDWPADLVRITIHDAEAYRSFDFVLPDIAPGKIYYLTDQNCTGAPQPCSFCTVNLQAPPGPQLDGIGERVLTGTITVDSVTPLRMAGRFQADFMAMNFETGEEFGIVRMRDGRFHLPRAQPGM